MTLVLGRRQVLLGGLALGGCAAVPDDIIGVAGAPTSAEAGPRSTHDIFVVTTRALDPNPAVLFSSRRSDGLSFASATVTIPLTHQAGRVERPDRLPPDPSQQMTVVEPFLYNEDGFVAAIDAALAARPRSDRHALVFVHGYNTTLAEALLRLGQFVEDSGYTGVPILFSWASGGRLLNYVYDLNSVLAARDDLIRAAEVLARTQTTAVDVVAHSMGNLLTVEAMRQAQLLGRFNETGRLRYIILASPDVDVDLFRRQLEPFPRDERRFFVLISRDDGALRVSRLLAGGVPRVGAGDVEPLAAIGVTVIDLSEIEVGGLSHTKFAESPEIVQLIGARLSRDGPLETAAGPSLAESLAASVAAVGATASSE
ncbi:alpha/beta hydrolase [Rubellimicrobium roseum]|uniref:Alpha/beta hydrolase n=1 Tax=Rubellimicrobium roseum TaxID=687525 RepID=A0A5C4N6J8_9RHOB|nr:alpha/beta hydrolase [Rubellimicrobium roseum]TNC66569.1 alpha/beta hydrolase [Rubellimicrobium roseum]